MRNALVIILICLGFSACSDHKAKGKLLDYPKTRQAYNYSCGPGSVESIMAYYGENFLESELIETLKTDTSEGTYVKDIVRFFHYNGLSTVVKQNMTIEELTRYIDRNIPVIVLIQAWGDENNYRKRYSDCWNDGHFAVVIGYTDKLILLSDPALYNVGYIPFAEFLDRWHDLDEGNTKTYRMGIAVFGKPPVFDSKRFERIE